MFSSFSRRQILKMIGAFIAGAVSLGSISLLGKWIVGAAQAQERGLSAATTIYKGREIVIEMGSSITQTNSRIQSSGPRLYIDGKLVDLNRDTKTGRYVTGYLPFEDFDSPQKLAKEMVDLGVPSAY